jgi:hypothetical protein
MGSHNVTQFFAGSKATHKVSFPLLLFITYLSRYFVLNSSYIGTKLNQLRHRFHQNLLRILTVKNTQA